MSWSFGGNLGFKKMPLGKILHTLRKFVPEVYLDLNQPWKNFIPPFHLGVIYPNFLLALYRSIRPTANKILGLYRSSWNGLKWYECGYSDDIYNRVGPTSWITTRWSHLPSISRVGLCLLWKKTSYRCVKPSRSTGIFFRMQRVHLHLHMSS